MNRHPAQKLPTILFGAFDLHNFGDLLFPHIVAALLQDRPLLYAGLTHRDLRPYGGHLVLPIHEVVANLKRQPINLIHVGGEILTCDNWLAAVMLLPDEQVQTIIAQLDHTATKKTFWAQQQLNRHDRTPYCISREDIPQCHQMIYNGVGGVDLAGCDSIFRNEIIRKLKAADRVAVRDRYTLSWLKQSGVQAQLIPDPAVMVAELFAQNISQEHAARKYQTAFPSGYIAIQFSADFGDDKTLATIAAELDKLITVTGLGLVFFSGRSSALA
jgi:Polysaccharide pyruvyl transferase.